MCISPPIDLLFLQHVTKTTKPPNTNFITYNENHIKLKTQKHYNNILIYSQIEKKDTKYTKNVEILCKQ